MLADMDLQITNTLLLWQEFAIVSRFWSYLTRQFTFGRITVSVSSVVVGVLVLIFTIFLARSASALIERRIAKRHHIDPGLRYTICRLVKYLVITIGLLVA